MGKRWRGCANLLLASSALTNFNFSHFSLSGFWKFLLLFFYFPPPCSCCFFAKSSSRRAAAKAKPTAARCQAKLEHMAATEPTDFHAYVPLRRILALLSGLRVTVPSFFFFSSTCCRLERSKKGARRGFCVPTRMFGYRFTPGFPFKKPATSVDPQSAQSLMHCCVFVSLMKRKITQYSKSFLN